MTLSTMKDSKLPVSFQWIFSNKKPRSNRKTRAWSIMSILLIFFFFKGSHSKGSRELWEAVRSRFSEPWGLTAVHTGPCFFPIERFLRLKEQQKMSSSRFSRSDRTIRSEFQNLGHGHLCAKVSLSCSPLNLLMFFFFLLLLLLFFFFFFNVCFV